MIRFTCPACQTANTAPDSFAGQKGPCPKCGQRLQIPAPPPLNKTVLGRIEDIMPGPVPAWVAPPAIPTLAPAPPVAQRADPPLALVRVSQIFQRRKLLVINMLRLFPSY
jgi:hypothetical protein